MKIGLQLYSVRESFQADPLGTLSAISDIGYKYVEFANHAADQHPGVGADIPADKLRAKLEECGIRPVGCHIAPFGPTYLDYLPDVLAYHKDLGTESIAIPSDYWHDKADVLEHCKLYNRTGELCRKSGIKLYYHNHYHEFQITGGRQIIDLIVENTDPELVSIELDTYWTIRGVVDPAAKIREYGNRVGMLHQKDFPLDQVRHLDVWTKLDRENLVDQQGFRSAKREEEFTEIGDGIMKIQDIIDAANGANVSYMLVEQDFGHGSEFQRVTRSLSNLHKMVGIDWD